MMMSGAYQSIADHNQDLASSVMTVPQHLQQQQHPHLSHKQMSFYPPNQGSMSHTANGSSNDLNSSEQGSAIGSMASVGISTLKNTGQFQASHQAGMMGMVQNVNMRPLVDPCVRCGFGGGDVRLNSCGCTLHTRCLELPNEGGLRTCPQCKNSINGISILPMSFRELDDAKMAAQVTSSLNGTAGKRKRKGIIDEPNGQGLSPGIDKQAGEESDQRTGRWTAAETAYVDELIAKFEEGSLPLPEGIKLNDFLAGMLQCKQSRLTKKMKNAKLSSRSFNRTTGFLKMLDVAREFSDLEEAFFHSIQCGEERAEMRFHMQKQWRELFSGYCVNLGQTLDADAWLDSVEEIERRASMAKDAARMARRKLMMGKALNQDSKNPDTGVIIDQSGCDMRIFQGPNASSAESIASGTAGPADYASLVNSIHACGNDFSDSPNNISRNFSPYLEKIMRFLERGGIPFEHVDAWVPSYVSTEGENMVPSSTGNDPKCRLCFGGSATMEINPPGRRQNRVTLAGTSGRVTAIETISQEEHFNLMSFGEYSQKFSFDIGCGLPGRVYSSGIPTWEQSVHNAPLEHFERCGGAIQCGIRTVVGIPVPSPNVGRIVIVLYSCHDREKDQELVTRLAEEFTRLAPTPRWKLIVDLGTPVGPPKASHQVVPTSSVSNINVLDLSTHTTADLQQGQMNIHSIRGKDSRVNSVVTLLGEHMPSDPASPLAAYLPGFMTLRLLMLRQARSTVEEDMVRTMLDSYESYTVAARDPKDIAVLLARDCMFMTAGQSQSNSTTNQQVFSVPQASNQSMYSIGNASKHNPSNYSYSQDRPNSAGSSRRGQLSSSIHRGAETLSTLVNSKSGQVSASVYNTSGHLSDALHATSGQLSNSMHGPSGKLSNSMHGTSAQLSNSTNATSGQLSNSIHNTSGQLSNSMHGTSVQFSNSMYSTSGRISNSMHGNSMQLFNSVHAVPGQPSNSKITNSRQLVDSLQVSGPSHENQNFYEQPSQPQLSQQKHPSHLQSQKYGGWNNSVANSFGNINNCQYPTSIGTISPVGQMVNSSQQKQNSQSQIQSQQQLQTLQQNSQNQLQLSQNYQQNSRSQQHLSQTYQQSQTHQQSQIQHQSQTHQQSQTQHQLHSQNVHQEQPSLNRHHQQHEPRPQQQ